MTEPTAEPSGEFVALPDGLQRLWTPHRMAYIDSHHDLPAGPPVCPFCAAPAKPDAEALIVARGRTAYCVLNLFPYNPGHLLVCPYRHVADYTDLTAGEVAEVAELTRRAMTVLRRVSHPDGFNLGINQGAVAGAGVADHFHQHIVPRWAGDANFFPVVAQTKALPQLLGDTCRLVTEAWA